jgi:hypothetical protein
VTLLFWSNHHALFPFVSIGVVQASFRGVLVAIQGAPASTLDVPVPTLGVPASTLGVLVSILDAQVSILNAPVSILDAPASILALAFVQGVLVSTPVVQAWRSFSPP